MENNILVKVFDNRYIYVTVNYKTKQFYYYTSSNKLSLNIVSIESFSNDVQKYGWQWPVSVSEQQELINSFAHAFNATSHIVINNDILDQCLDELSIGQDLSIFKNRYRNKLKTYTEKKAKERYSLLKRYPDRFIRYRLINKSNIDIVVESIDKYQEMSSKYEWNYTYNTNWNALRKLGSWFENKYSNDLYYHYIAKAIDELKIGEGFDALVEIVKKHVKDKIDDGLHQQIKQNNSLYREVKRLEQQRKQNEANQRKNDLYYSICAYIAKPVFRSPNTKESKEVYYYVDVDVGMSHILTDEVLKNRLQKYLKRLNEDVINTVTTSAQYKRHGLWKHSEITIENIFINEKTRTLHYLISITPLNKDT